MQLSVSMKESGWDLHVNTSSLRNINVSKYSVFSPILKIFWHRPRLKRTFPSITNLMKFLISFLFDRLWCRESTRYDKVWTPFPLCCILEWMERWDTCAICDQVCMQRSSSLSVWQLYFVTFITWYSFIYFYAVLAFSIYVFM